MLIVEDGTAKPDAESYASVAQADAFLSSRGNTIWAPLAEVHKEEALRRATDYMITEYRPKWLGRRKSAAQSLDWPRSGVELGDVGYIAENVVPSDIINSCIELALRAASGELVEDEEATVLEETIGPITTKYDKRGQTPRKRYTAIDNRLRPYTLGVDEDGAIRNVKLVRC